MGSVAVLLLLLLTAPLSGQEGAPGSGASLRLDFTGGEHPGDLGIAIQILLLMTLLTLAPSMVMLMTSFTRIVIVLGFVRSALGVHQAPSNQIIIGLALFLTFFLMGPIWNRIYEEAVVPYMEEKITSKEALLRGSGELKGFMLKQTRASDLELTTREFPLAI